MKNYKDTISTICGIIIAFGGTILALPTQGITIPTWMTTVATVLVAIAGTVMGILIGKNADMSKKTTNQLSK